MPAPETMAMNPVPADLAALEAGEAAEKPSTVSIPSPLAPPPYVL